MKSTPEPKEAQKLTELRPTPDNRLLSSRGIGRRESVSPFSRLPAPGRRHPAWFTPGRWTCTVPAHAIRSIVVPRRYIGTRDWRSPEQEDGGGLGAVAERHTLGTAAWKLPSPR